MRTIVTGGGGFIGSHLVELLIRENHNVIVIDNFVNGRMENLVSLKNHPNLKVVNESCENYSQIKDNFIGIDWVFHLAALADIVPSIQNPLAYHQANVDGTISVLEAARNANVKRFLYAASSSCYGIPDIFPTPETAEIRPQYPYALTKYLGEQYVLHWGKIYQLPVVSLRLFNVYGTRSRTSGTYGAVFGVFLKQKLAGQPFTIVGDGTQTRDFTYVTDVANAFLTAAKSNISSEIFNVGSDHTYSVNYLAELLGGDKIFIPKRPGEPDQTFADISKIKSILGWQTAVTFETGVKTVLENIDYWKNAPLWTPDTIKEATKDWFKYLGKNNG